jgi:uncharacterized protein YcbK (DUF882 family)
MKVKIFTQNLTNDELSLVKEAMTKVKNYLPQLEFFYKTTTKKFTSLPFTNNVAKGYVLNNSEILSLADGTEDIVLLIYDATKVIPSPTNPSTNPIKKGNCIPISIHKQWYNGDIETLVIYFLHELSHAEAYRYGKVDNTENFYTSQFAQSNDTPMIRYYLSLLKEIWKTQPVIQPTPTMKYKYFTEKEVKGLKPELVQLLDKIRGECGFPFVINSGFRTIEENNKLKDSVEDSAHTLGLAVDIKCLTSDKRFKIIQSALKNGIVRIGLNNTYIHMDLDGSKPQMVAWLYK